ncbi:MaoC/PaaZ C-terminal domain-containing protein [Dietzia sp. B32]|uniref:MaoC/PaaZ C-terminal domain-containing protein n=1 Tax=Dietzia sp. B32 TaxID=2915130 RepID=UPI0021AD7BAE|nr:MaoC/PaaZ C-terminal domain-containing protein [Dietzia sp. B32]UVE96259.1 MaoC family dehydratase N-terminal domain-containing protein [Dietzia sp. B32]
MTGRDEDGQGKDGQDTTTTTRTAATGDVLPSRTLPISRDDLRRYAEASGDHNPIHLDDDAARALGLPGVVAHGMLTSALAIGVVAEWAGGADRVVATSFRFAGPVVVPADEPARLEVAGSVRKVAEDGSTADVALAVTCGGSKVFGKAIVTVSLAG